MIEIYNIRC